MNRVAVACVVIMFFSIAFATTAVAQDESGRSDGVATCTSAEGASRIRTACGEEEQTILRIEREVSVFNEAVQLETRECASEIAVEYFQRNTIARVNGSIENETCAASSGEYEVAIRIRDSEGELEDLEFDESWERDGDERIEFTADYEIGDNVELIRLRTQGLRCLCNRPDEE